MQPMLILSRGEVNLVAVACEQLDALETNGPQNTTPYCTEATECKGHLR